MTSPGIASADQRDTYIPSNIDGIGTSHFDSARIDISTFGIVYITIIPYIVSGILKSPDIDGPNERLAAVVMSYANKVMIVPGYGLAVAQAQHTCHELEKLLSAKGVEVSYAIHPVAGRMPGHMNVLLAEADVSYEKLLEMEQANEEFPTTDVVLILGANDVVNPAAKTDPASPIYGMPILDVESAKHVIVNKRSMKPGYAGIENDLFFRPKTSMLFGDAKKVLQDLITEVKNS